MNLSKFKFVYCDECMHVYYNSPSQSTCAICHNELNPKNLLSDLDILICETCNRIYSIQKPEEMIPNFENNDNFLCGCKNNCPTMSYLAIGQQQTFFGNIIKADIYKCSNCGAISFRNMGSTNRGCYECGSKYLHALNWDSTTHRIFYQCANPQHHIRLKLRDLIERNNQKVDEKIEVVKKQEKKLFETYNSEREKLHQEYSTNNLRNKLQKLQKKQTPFEIHLAKLNIWALEERKKLYSSITPLGLRCAVYQEKQMNDKTQLRDTGAGCNALAHIKIRKVVIAPDGTIMDKEPENSNDSQNMEEANDLSLMTPNSGSISLIDQNHNSIFTQILRSPSLVHEEGLDFKKPTISSPQFEKSELIRFPVLNDNQIILKIDLYLRRANEEVFEINNSGYIPLEYSNNNPEIKIGKEHFISAYWKYPERFAEIPFVFDNILSTEQDKFHFAIQRDEGEYFLIPNSSNFNLPLKYSENDAISDIHEKIDLNPTQKFLIQGFYSIDKNIGNEYHQIQFQIQVITPKHTQDMI